MDSVHVFGVRKFKPLLSNPKYMYCLDWSLLDTCPVTQQLYVCLKVYTNYPVLGTWTTFWSWTSYYQTTVQLSNPKYMHYFFSQTGHYETHMFSNTALYMLQSVQKCNAIIQSQVYVLLSVLKMIIIRPKSSNTTFIHVRRCSKV